MKTILGWAAAKDDCTKHANNITTNLVTIISTHPLEARNAAGGDPFGYEDVAGVVEAGVMGMNELTVNPCLSVTAINTFLFHDAFDVITNFSFNLFPSAKADFPKLVAFAARVAARAKMAAYLESEKYTALMPFPKLE